MRKEQEAQWKNTEVDALYNKRTAGGIQTHQPPRDHVEHHERRHGVVADRHRRAILARSAPEPAQAAHEAPLVVELHHLAIRSRQRHSPIRGDRADVDVDELASVVVARIRPRR